MYYIYKITNLVNGKIYIGQTNNSRRRWLQHISSSKLKNPPQHINRSMKKYGVEKFTFEILEICQTLEGADTIKTSLISKFDSRNKDVGYNKLPGGSGASEEKKKQLSELFLGNHHSIETEFKEGHPQLNTGRTHFQKEQEPYNKGLPPEKQPRFGAKLTEQHINIIKESNKKKRKLTIEQIIEIKRLRAEENMSFVKIGKQFSISESCIRDIWHNRTYKI